MALHGYIIRTWCILRGKLRNRMRFIGPYNLYKGSICMLNCHTKHWEACVKIQENIGNTLEWQFTGRKDVCRKWGISGTRPRPCRLTDAVNWVWCCPPVVHMQVREEEKYVVCKRQFHAWHLFWDYTEANLEWFILLRRFWWVQWDLVTLDLTDPWFIHYVFNILSVFIMS